MEKITEIEAVEESKRSKNCLLAINISRAEVVRPVVIEQVL